MNEDCIPLDQYGEPVEYSNASDEDHISAKQMDDYERNVGLRAIED